MVSNGITQKMQAIFKVSINSITRGDTISSSTSSQIILTARFWQDLLENNFRKELSLSLWGLQK